MMNFFQINYETHWKSPTCRWIYVLISSPSLFLQAAGEKDHLQSQPALGSDHGTTSPVSSASLNFSPTSHLLALSIPLECGSGSILRLPKQVTKIVQQSL